MNSQLANTVYNDRRNQKKAVIYTIQRTDRNLIRGSLQLWRKQQTIAFERSDLPVDRHRHALGEIIINVDQVELANCSTSQAIRQ